MTDVNKAFFDYSVKQAIAYENKESKARQIGKHKDAENFQSLAKHHKSESSKYLAAMEAL